jgi:Txe/YoeB family toxin of Txe-Axe toxin-antitoxin module
MNTLNYYFGQVVNAYLIKDIENIDLDKCLKLAQRMEKKCPYIPPQKVENFKDEYLKGYSRDLSKEERLDVHKRMFNECINGEYITVAAKAANTSIDSARRHFKQFMIENTFNIERGLRSLQNYFIQYLKKKAHEQGQTAKYTKK